MFVITNSKFTKAAIKLCLITFDITAWQNRPLDTVYPFIFMDAILGKNSDILSTFFAYSTKGSRIIYATNTIGSLNRQFRMIKKQAVTHQRWQPERNFVSSIENYCRAFDRNVSKLGSCLQPTFDNVCRQEVCVIGFSLLIFFFRSKVLFAHLSRITPPITRTQRLRRNPRFRLLGKLHWLQLFWGCSLNVVNCILYKLIREIESLSVHNFLPKCNMDGL